MIRSGILVVLAIASLAGCASRQGTYRLGQGKPHDRKVTPADFLIPPFVPVAVHFRGDFDPALSRDGGSLVFVSERSGNWDLWHLQTGQRTAPVQLTQHTGADFAPSVSPDGKRVAFITRRSDAKGDLAFIRIKTGEKDFTSPPGQETTAEEDPAWIDHDRLLLTRIHNGIKSLWTYDSRAVEFADSGIRNAWMPDVSSDGKWAVFTRQVRGRTEIQIAEIRDGKLARPAKLTSLAFQETMAVFGGAQRLYIVVNADDTNNDGIIDANDRTTLWSVSFDPETGKAGSDIQAITDSSSIATLPAATGTSLVVTSDRSGQLNLWSLDVAGIPVFTGDELVQAARTLPDLSQRLLAYRRITPGVAGNDAARAALYYRAEELLNAGAWGPADAALRRVVDGDRSDYWGHRAEILQISLDGKVLQATGLGLDDPEIRDAFESNRQGLLKRVRDASLEPDLRALSLFELGRLQAEMQQVIPALETYQQVELEFGDIDNVAGEAALERARIFSEMGDRASSVDLLKAVIVRYEGAEGILLRAATQAIALASGLYTAAEDRIAALRRLEHEAPDYLRVRIALEVAAIYRASQDYFSCRAELDDSRTRVEPFPKLKEQWAAEYVQLVHESGNPSHLDDLALPVLMSSETTRRKFVDVLLLLLHDEPVDDAEKARIFRMALRADPDSPEVRYAGWQLNLAENGPLPKDPATQKYVDALRTWGESRSPRSAQKAIRLIDDALAIQFNRPELHHFRGYLSNALEQFLILDNVSYSKRQDGAHLEAAIDSYQTALVYARQNGLGERVRELNLALALAFMDFPSPNYRLAAEFLDAYFASGGYPADRRRALIVADRRARSLFHTERFDEAARAARDGIAVSRELNDRAAESALGEYLAMILAWSGNHAEAVAAYDELLRNMPSGSPTRYLLLRNRGISQFRSGDNAGALASLDEWDREREENRKFVNRRAKRAPPTFSIALGPTATSFPWGFDSDAEQLLGNTYAGWAHEAAGHAGEALVYRAGALREKPAAGDVQAQQRRAISLTQAARLEVASGNRERAGNYLKEARELAEASGDLQGQGMVTASEMELLLLEREVDSKAAGVILRRSASVTSLLEQQRSEGIPVNLRVIAENYELRALLRLRLLKPDSPESLIPFRELVRSDMLWMEMEKETGKSTIRRRLAGLLNRAKAASAAGYGEHLDEILEDYEETGRPYRFSDLRLWRYALKCDLSGDESACIAFLDELDTLGPSVPSILSWQSRQVFASELLAKLSVLWIRRYHETAGRAYLERAAETGERIRRVSVLWTLGTIAEPGRDNDRKLYGKLTAALKKWNSAVEQLSRMREADFSGPLGAVARTAQKAADDAIKEYRSAIMDLREQSPELASLLMIRPTSIADLQYDLPEGEAIVATSSDDSGYIITDEREIRLVGKAGLLETLSRYSRVHLIGMDSAREVHVSGRYVSFAHYQTSWLRRNINKRRGMFVADAAVSDEGSVAGKQMQQRLEALASAIPGIRGFFYEDSTSSRFVEESSSLDGQYHFIHFSSTVRGSGRNLSIGFPGGGLPLWRLTELSGEPHLWVFTDFMSDAPDDRMAFIELAAYSGVPAMILGKESQGEASAPWQDFYRSLVDWKAPPAGELWNSFQAGNVRLSEFEFWGYPGIPQQQTDAFASKGLSELANRAATEAAARNWKAAALAAERAVTMMDVVGVDPRILAQMLNAAVYSLKQLQLWSRAAGYEDRLAKLYAEAGAFEQSVKASYFAGQDYMRANRFDDALERFELALRSAKGSPQMRVVIESEQARCLALAGRKEEAIEVYSRAIANAATARDEESRAELLFNRARIRLETETELDFARPDIDNSTAIYQKRLEAAGTDRPLQAQLYRFISRNRLTAAMVEMANGNLQVAEREFGELSSFAEQSGDGATAVQARIYRAEALRRMSRPAKALAVVARYLDPATVSVTAAVDAGNASDLLGIAGLIHWSLGDEKMARDYGRAALDRARESTDPSRVSKALYNLGTTLRVTGDTDEADKLFTEALETDRRRKDVAGELAVILQAALLEEQRENPVGAKEILSQGLELARRHARNRESVQFRWMLARYFSPVESEAAKLWSDARALGDSALLARVRTVIPPHLEKRNGGEGASLAEFWLRELPSSRATEVRNGLYVDKAAILRKAVEEISRNNPVRALQYWEAARLKLLKDHLHDTGLYDTSMTVQSEQVQLRSSRDYRKVEKKPVYGQKFRSGDRRPPGGLWDRLGLPVTEIAPLPEIPYSALVSMYEPESGKLLWWFRKGTETDFHAIKVARQEFDRTVMALTELVRSQGRYEAALVQAKMRLFPGALLDKVRAEAVARRLLWMPDDGLAGLPLALLISGEAPDLIPQVIPQIALLAEAELGEGSVSAASGTVTGHRDSRLRAGFGVTFERSGRALFFAQEREHIELKGLSGGWIHCAGVLSVSRYSVSGVRCEGEPMTLPASGFSASAVDRPLTPTEMLALRIPALNAGFSNPWITPQWRRGVTGAEFWVRYHELRAGGTPTRTSLEQAGQELGKAYGHPFIWGANQVSGLIASPAE